jgi:hypothetical protein
MNAHQVDKLNMYYVVKNTCEKYQATWVTNAVFAATYNLWVAKVPLIEQNRDAQTVGTTGITTNTAAKRLIMIDKALFIENRLQSLANVTGNSELLESVQYTATEMKTRRGVDVVSMCNAILLKANANATSLVAYGVTAAMITDLQNAIIDYSTSFAKPKAAKSQTKTATENLLKLFKEAEGLLINRMDLDIEIFKTSKPDFYSQYKTARIVISTGGGGSSVLGSVTSAGSGEPLKGVTFTFVAGNNGLMKATTSETAKPVVKKSAAKGKFRVALAEGIYTVRVGKIGFKEQEVVITVANGERTNLKVELEKN